ncbi:MAG: O-antigen ligase family protein [Anaerovoracaceae bacterium]
MRLRRSEEYNHLNNLLSTSLALFCLLMPFEEVMAGAFGSILKLIGIFILALSLCYIRSIRISKIWVSLLVWIVYCMASYFWSNSYTWWAYFFKIYLSQAAFVIVLAQVPPRYIDLRKVKASIAFGAVVASSIMIFFPTASAYIEGRRTIAFGDAHINPNLLAAIFVMGLYALFSLSAMKRGSFRKILYYCAIGIILAGLLYTGSRGSMIALVCSFAVMLVVAQKNNGGVTSWKILLILAGTVILVILMMKYIPEDYLESRFSWDNIFGLNEYRNGSHNRYTIWLYSWDLFKQNPIIGYGCGNFFDVIATVYKECAAHNIVVLSAVENGIIGSVPLFLFLYGIIRRAYRSGNSICFGMLTAVLIISLTLDSLPYKYFWIAMILSYWEADIIKVQNDRKKKHG